MKRILALLLTTMLLLSCLPLTAAAAKNDASPTATGVEAKFRLLLEDLELKDNLFRSDRYFFEELGQYPAKNPAWVLLRGGLYDLSAKNDIRYQYAAFGNKLVRANVNSTPFQLGYGVYDVKSGVFYDLVDAWKMNLNNLRDVWDDLSPTTPYSEKDKSSEGGMYVIGDADSDGEVTIIDATRIQRYVADLEKNPWENFTPTGDDFVRGAAFGGATDCDRDGDTTILDATRIQRGLAELPSALDYRLAWNKDYIEPGAYRYQEATLLTDPSQIKDDNGDPEDDAMLRAAYDDAFFKEHCLLVINDFHTNAQSPCYELTLKNVSIDGKGVLNADFDGVVSAPSGEFPYHHFIVIELSNAFIDDIRDIRTNIKEIKERTYALMWNRKIEFAGFDMESEMITEANQLDANNEYHARLLADLGADEEKAFRKYDYFLARVPLGSAAYTLSTPAPVIDEKGVLQLRIVAGGPRIGSAVENSRLVCVRLSKDWLRDSRDWNAQLVYDYTDEASFRYRPAKHPNLSVQGDGEATLYTSRSQLNPGLEGHQTLLDDYDEAFFEHYCLLAVHYDLSSGEYLSQFESLYESGSQLNVNMLEYKQDHASSDRDVILNERRVRFCLEVNKVLLSSGANSAKVIHRAAAAEPSLFDRHADLHAAAPVPEGYVEAGYTKVGFDNAYSECMDIPGASAKTYSDVLRKGNYDSGKGVAAVIANPCDMEAVVHDDSLSNGYSGGSFSYRIDRTYDYDLKFFRDYALVAVAIHYAGNEPTLSINGLYKKDGVLYIDTALKDDSYEPLESDNVAFVKVRRSDLRDVAAVKLARLIPDSTLYAEIPPADQIAEIPQEPAAQGYQSVSAIKVALSAPAAAHIRWEDFPFGASDRGYVMLIRTRGEMEKYLPGFDKEKHLDETYFKNNILLAMIGQGTDYGDTAELSDIWSKGSTLYVNARVESHHSTQNGTPVAQPTAPLVWTFRQIKKSDLAEADAIGFWKASGADVGEFLAFSEIENHRPDGGCFSEESAAILLRSPDGAAAAIDSLYVDDQGNPIERTCTYQVERYTESDFADQSVIAMRVFQGGSNNSLEVASVRRSGSSELTVEVERRCPDDAVTPDNQWRFIFLSIPKCDRDYTVKVNTTYADNKVYKNFEYFINRNDSTGEKTAMILRYRGRDAGVTVPNTIEDCPVTVIRPKAFSGNTTLTSVALPKNLIEIDESAFSDCTVLRGVNFLGEKVRWIGNSAFANCPMLESVTIPNDSLQFIGWNLFSGCTALKQIRIPEPKALNEIPKGTFSGCTSLAKVAIPASITGIGDEAFHGCSSLTEITLPATVEAVGASAFRNCDKLKKATVERWDTQFGTKALGYLDSTTTPDFTICGFEDSTARKYAADNNLNFSVIRINWEDVRYNVIEDHEYAYTGANAPGETAFRISSADQVKEAIGKLYNDSGAYPVPHDDHRYLIEDFGEDYFNSRDVIVLRVRQGNHDSVVIPGTLHIHQPNVDMEVTVRTTTDVPESTVRYRMIFLCIQKWRMNYDVKIKRNHEEVHSISGDYEYYINSDNNAEICVYLGSDESVTTPVRIDGKKVVAIRREAFAHSKVKHLTVSDGVTAIGSRAFASSSVETATLPDSVTSLGDAFYYCSSLKSVKLPKNLKTIPGSVFQACSSLTSVTLPDAPVSVGTQAFSYCRSLKNITLPDSVTTIGDNAFAHCGGLESITLPAKLTAISQQLFLSCSALTTVSVPKPVTSVGKEAFKNCTALTEIQLSDSVKTIGSGVFTGCTALTEIRLPNSVTAIGSGAFEGCTSLQRLNLPSGVTSLSSKLAKGCEKLSVLLQNSGNLTVKTVGDEALRDCRALETINFTNALTDIGQNAFRGCTALNWVSLQENLKTIHTNAFLDCPALKKLTVPKSVATIYEHALGYALGDNSAYVRRGDFTIRGYLGTYAAFYAGYFGITFEPIIEDENLAFNLMEDYSPEEDFVSEEPIGIHITNQQERSEAIDALYTVNGEVLSRGDKTFVAENTYIYGNRDFVAMRIYKGGPLAQVLPEKVTITGDRELTVDVKRRLPEGKDADGKRWSLLFIDIPKLGERYTVKVNVRDDT